MSRTCRSSKLLQITQRQRPQPPPMLSQRAGAAIDEKFNGRFAGEERLGQRPKKNGVLHDRRRRNASTSLTLREQFCAGRAATLTRRKSDLLKFPWGNPREAQPGPKAQSKPSLEHSTARQQYSSFVYVARAPPAKNQPWLRNGRSGITGKGPASEVAEKRPTRAPPWKSGPSRT